MAVKAPPPAAEGGSFTIDASYLYWSAKGDSLPALVTTGGTGVLGAAGTSVLFGNSDVNDDGRSGFRIQAGYRFDPSKRTGIDAHFFILGDTSTDFSAASAGAPLLARPFLNATTGLQDALLIASPGLVSGSIAITEESRLLGAGAAYRTELCTSCVGGGPVSGVIGYRYLRLRDDLRFFSFQNAPGIPAVFTTNEQFSTANDFHGLDLGLTGEILRGPWSLVWLAKLALGGTFTGLDISGSTVTVSGGGTVTSAGGLLALPTNIGSFSESRFAVVPELSARLGYQFTPRLRGYVGYDVLWWTGVVRPGGAIDTTVNPTQLSGGALVGPARPAVRFGSDTYWVQGVSVGLAFAL
jgi:hypothetical protein